MSAMKRRLAEDRALRDAARNIFQRDVALIQADVEEQGLASRVLATGAEYMHVVADGAVDLIKDHRGRLSGGAALLAAGLAAWIYRHEIGDLVAGMLDGLHADEDDQNEAAATDD